MKLIRIITIALLINICNHSFGQEVRGLNYQPTVEAASRRPMLKSAAEHIVPKPSDHYFFDDFTTYGNEIFPISNNWIDQNAIITHSMADSVISYGVITLDCFNKNGRVNGTPGRTNPSDTLTSEVFEVMDSTNVYMSFFIQGGGKGDAPEFQDSLLLEMRTPRSKKWLRAWSSHGYKSNSFDQKIVRVADSLIIDSTLQFRFINFISLSASEVQGKEGALSNADNWHIDYIQVKKATDTIEMTKFSDVAITEYPIPSFSDYSLIPLNHLQHSSGYNPIYIDIWFRTMFTERVSNVDIGRSHIQYDKDYSKTIEHMGVERDLQNSINSNTITRERDSVFLYSYNLSEHPNRKEGNYQIKSWVTLVQDNLDNYLWNDTIVREEQFRDFYSYDDGSAEFGFGITGADAYNAAIASEFELYQQTYPDYIPDTLTGVYIYFNQVAELFTSDLEFQVLVWDAVEVTSSTPSYFKPNNIIYESNPSVLFTPDTNKGFNSTRTNTDGFMRIDFNEDVMVSNHYFVGILQYTNEFINIGYDNSFDSKKHIWYYTNNTWNSAAKINTIPPGSLMIRPIFDHFDFTTGLDQPIRKNSNPVTLYPNPVSHTINIKYEGYDDLSAKIYNSIGQLVLDQPVNGTSINVNFLPTGLYIINLFDGANNRITSQKIYKKEY